MKILKIIGIVLIALIVFGGIVYANGYAQQILNAETVIHTTKQYVEIFETQHGDTTCYTAAGVTSYDFAISCVKSDTMGLIPAIQ